MLAAERKQYIKELLQKDRKVVVADLAEHFEVTEETIRRDLMKLESEGMAKKIYGGAILSDDSNVDLPYSVRKLNNVEEKQKIAEVLEKMIPDSTNIMFDGSSTALFVVKALKIKPSLTVMTTSSEIVCELSDKSSWRVYATGGLLKEGGYAFIGARAVEAIKSFHADIAVFSCKGVDFVHGLTDASDEDAEIKKAIIKTAKKKILAIDSTKFSTVSLMEIGGFDDINVVATDRDPGAEWKTFFEEKDIELYYEI